MVQFVGCQVYEFFFILILLLNADTDFVLNEFLIFVNALTEYVIAVLKLLCHIKLLSVLIKHILEFLQ